MKRENDLEIGKIMRQQRLARGMSQEDLGKVLGVTFQQIQKYETGRNRISAQVVKRVAEHWEISPMVFFGDLPEEDRILDRYDAFAMKRFLAIPPRQRNLLLAFWDSFHRAPGLKEAKAAADYAYRTTAPGILASDAVKKFFATDPCKIDTPIGIGKSSYSKITVKGSEDRINLDPESFVILNDIDRPDERHVAYKNERGTYSYYCEELKAYTDMGATRPTSLSHFGFYMVHEDDDSYTLKQITPSIATYKEGGIRQWQGASIFKLNKI